MTDLYEELEFPLRAEYIDQYDNYKVDISHWRVLAQQFQKAFREVHVRHGAAVLLVYGPQGAGKSMFCSRLRADYERTRRGSNEPDVDNLWHVLAATDRPTEQAIEDATTATTLQLVDERGSQDWLGELKAFAKADKSRVRVFLFDDAQKDGMMRAWTDLSAKEFYEARQTGPDMILANVAERINDACRHEFKRSIFVFMSNERPWIDALQGHLERWFKELATTLTLPAPEPQELERIVRINTNRLNRVSYWYCLVNATEDDRREVRRVFVDKRPFTESFHAVSKSLDGTTRRSGRPSNPNVLTLVTLGSEYAAVRAFLEDREIVATETEHGVNPRHLGVWEMRGPWASKLLRKPEREFMRRARMLESEFMLRWVNLDVLATHVLLADPRFLHVKLQDDLWGIVLWRPSTGTLREVREKRREDCVALDGLLPTVLPTGGTIDAFAAQFKGAGQRRSIDYEKDLRLRLESRGFTQFGRGFAVHSSLRPDLIVSKAESPEAGEYRRCALTDARQEDDIAEVIRRTGHCVEFTSFLRENLEGLEGYLKDKVDRYAGMLESV